MLLWGELILPVIPSTLEGHIVQQMKNIVGGLVNKREDHIQRDRQNG